MPAWFSRLLNTFRRKRLEAVLEEEVQTHLDLLTREYQSRGMSAEAARRAARRAFGAVEPMKEQYRDRRGLRWVEEIAHDVRYAARSLRRNPAFTTTALLTLALGIGANTALFSVLHALLLRNLPVEQPHELVIVALNNDAPAPDTSVSYPFFQELRQQAQGLVDLATTTGAARKQMAVGGEESVGVETIEAEAVSGNYFSTLRVPTILGRALGDADDSPAAQGAVVLSHSFWMRRFGGDPAVLGRTITFDDTPFTIVGVAAPAFSGLEVGRRSDLWWPIQLTPRGDAGFPDALRNEFNEFVTVFGRVRPGITRNEAQARLHAYYQATLEERYRRRLTLRGARFTPDQRAQFFRTRLELHAGATGHTDLRYRYGTPLMALVALVGIVLLVACANVANLLLARAASRQRELAVRIAIGAGRSRLVRQMLTESAVLAIAASALGLAVAVWLSKLLISFVPDPRFALSLGIDQPVLLFTLGLSLATAVLCGTLPALTSTRRVAAATLAAHTRASAARPRLLNALVVAQVALSVVVLISATLFLRSLQNLRSVDLGFAPAGLTVFRLMTPANYDASRREAIYRQVVERLDALPDTEGVTFSVFGLLSGSNATTPVEIPGYTPSDTENLSVQTSSVGPRFFEITRIPVLKGRALGVDDERAGRRVAVVDETMAARFFGGDAVGRRFFIRGSTEPVEIVGVAANAKYRNLKERPLPTVYTPFNGGLMASFIPVQVEVRTSDRTPLREDVIRRVVRDVDPSVAALNVRTMQQAIDATIPEDRLLSVLATLFGGLVLVVAAIGIYGVTSFAAARRTAEMAIRTALGATRGELLRDTLWRALALTIGGAVIGTLAAASVTRFVAGLLYQVEPRDPANFVAAVVVFGFVALLASYVPARRASSIQPAVLLRSE